MWLNIYQGKENCLKSSKSVYFEVVNPFPNVAPKEVITIGKNLIHKNKTNDVEITEILVTKIFLNPNLTSEQN